MILQLPVGVDQNNLSVHGHSASPLQSIRSRRDIEMVLLDEPQLNI